MIPKLDIDDFLRLARSRPVIDVRSPAEFQRGHIPGAVNICLFDDDERAEIGRMYRDCGSSEAFSRGMELANPKLARFVGDALALAPGKKVMVYCWRGGMRSENFAFLLQTSGFDACTLNGGYKAYRHKIIESFDAPAPLIVIGGMTGSGKTKYLNLLSMAGYQAIDLENLAHHKGSVFGAIGMSGQPSTEQFQNDLFSQWQNLDMSRFIFIEDENMEIGSVDLPSGLYLQMRTAPAINLELSRNRRIARLADEYSGNDEQLRNCVKQLERRLGGLNMNLALEAIAEGDYTRCAEILLIYYDKAYAAGIAKRNPSCVVSLAIDDFTEDEVILDIIAKAADIAEKRFHPAV